MNELTTQKSELTQSINVHLHPNVKEALVNPKRFLEVRGWLKTNQDKARLWRGEDGETMMHWAFCSDWVLASELREAGLSFQDKDNYSRTPMDWLNDRLWLSIVNDKTNTQLSLGGKERLRNHTIKQIQYLWPQGARPSFDNNKIHPGVIWIRSGAWELLELLKDDDNFSGWKNWLPSKGSALHAWILSPNMPQRQGFLNQWQGYGLSVDIQDKDGRTPLWYAVDAWIYSKKWRSELSIVIESLINAGASPLMDDIDGITPLIMIDTEYKKVISILENFKETSQDKSLLQATKEKRDLLKYKKSCEKIIKLLTK